MPSRQRPLGLHEELMLLFIHDENGVVMGSWCATALGGAILAELLLQERIQLEKEGRKTFLNLVRSQPTGDEVLDEAIARIQEAKRRGTVQTWVSRISGMKRLPHRVAMQLCDRQILRADERQILLFFKRFVYLERDPEPERKIMARLEQAIFREGAVVDPRTVVLLSLARNSQLLPILFDKKRLAKQKAHMDRVLNGDTLGKATAEVIQSVQMAIMAATMVPIIVAATSTH